MESTLFRMPFSLHIEKRESRGLGIDPIVILCTDPLQQSEYCGRNYGEIDDRPCQPRFIGVAVEGEEGLPCMLCSEWSSTQSGASLLDEPLTGK